MDQQKFLDSKTISNKSMELPDQSSTKAGAAKTTPWEFLGLIWWIWVIIGVGLLMLAGAVIYSIVCCRKRCKARASARSSTRSGGQPQLRTPTAPIVDKNASQVPESQIPTPEEKKNGSSKSKKRSSSQKAAPALAPAADVKQSKRKKFKPRSGSLRSANRSVQSDDSFMTQEMTQIKRKPRKVILPVTNEEKGSGSDRLIVSPSPVQPGPNLAKAQSPPKAIGS